MVLDKKYCYFTGPVMVGQIWPQEETQKGLRKTKFIINFVSRNRRHATPSRAMWESSRVGQEAEGAGLREKSRTDLYWRGKKRQARAE